MEHKYLNSTIKERREWLNLSLDDRIVITSGIIKEVLNISKFPIVQFSGGIDSCFMSWIVRSIDSDIPNVFNDWGIFLPQQERFCLEFFKKYNIRYYISKSGITDKEFLIKYGFPIFKGLKNIVSKNEYAKYNITTKCRMLKHKCWNNFYKTYPFDYFFVGILADESPQRKSLFLQYGFLSKKDKGFLVKPIALIRKSEIFELCNKYNILYPVDYYRDFYEGTKIEYNHCDLGCYMCGIRFQKYGFGRLGRLARNNSEKYNEILNAGLLTTLEKIVSDKPEKANYIASFLRHYSIENRKVAYDLDGVLCPLIKRNKPFFEQTSMERNLFNEKKKIYFSNAPIYKNPTEPFYIITGRREKYRKITERWLEEKGIEYKELIMMTGSLTFKNIYNHKYKWIKELGIERYYDDDIKIISQLHKDLPNLELIHVKRTDKNVVNENDIQINQTQKTLF